ncbi:hypothetical protein V2053_000928 [Vibrio cholerae]|uniref:DUF6035 family protein n=1 Tax=Vibrio parahaemolyticus TaxID=670 RepID=UPI002F30B99B|nr:hypothetical protein [Vibrio parahaemolyticus]
MRNMTSVFMTEESKVIDANEFLDTTDEKILFELRTEIAKNRKTTPVVLCNVCFQPVLLKGTPQRTKYFAHVKDSEDCPIKTTTNLTAEEILAMKYNGQKEGRLHREGKETLAQYLSADSLFHNDVHVEKTFREKHPTGIAKRWRRPDISATLLKDSREVVFELQVSTTFLDVIISREQFYKENDAYITWVFLDFDAEKFTTLDIAYANKANVFVLDNEAKHESDLNGKLVLKCYYRQPFMTEDLNIAHKWVHELVDFSMLNFDELNKKTYLVDTDALRAEVINNINDEKRRQQLEQEERERAKQEALRQEREEQTRLDKLARSYSHFQTPNHYKEKAHRSKHLSQMPSSTKSLGGTLICRKCMNIGKPKKVGRLTVCGRCGHELI